MRGDFVAVGVQVLDLGVVGPFVGDVKGRGDRAPVRVDPAPLEQLAVQALVQVVDGVVERQQDQLRDLLRAVSSCKRNGRECATQG